MNKQQRIIPALGEMAFPLIGMFYLDWSLYFIVLYYLLDCFANEVFYHVEAKSIFIFHGKKKEDKRFWLRSGIIQSIAFFCVLFIAHFAMISIYPKMNLAQEFWAFLMYTEDLLPIPQVYVLLPLVFLPKYMQYKNEFIVKQKVRTFTLKTYVFARRKAWLLTLALTGLLYSLSFIVQLPPAVWLVFLVLPKLTYDVWIVKN
ncbi:MAG: hypothetical protein ACPGU5_02690 [Lishizhenia sp.]